MDNSNADAGFVFPSEYPKLSKILHDYTRYLGLIDSEIAGRIREDNQKTLLATAKYWKCMWDDPSGRYLLLKWIYHNKKLGKDDRADAVRSLMRDLSPREITYWELPANDIVGVQPTVSEPDELGSTTKDFNYATLQKAVMVNGPFLVYGKIEEYCANQFKHQKDLLDKMYKSLNKIDTQIEAWDSEPEVMSQLDVQMQKMEESQSRGIAELQRVTIVEGAIQRTLAEGWKPGEVRRNGNITCCFGTAPVHKEDEFSLSYLMNDEDAKEPEDSDESIGLCDTPCYYDEEGPNE